MSKCPLPGCRALNHVPLMSLERALDSHGHGGGISVLGLRTRQIRTADISLPSIKPLGPQSLFQYSFHSSLPLIPLSNFHFHRNIFTGLISQRTRPTSNSPQVLIDIAHKSRYPCLIILPFTSRSLNSKIIERLLVDSGRDSIGAF